MTQVGGTHYQSSYQHWDMTTDCGNPYLEGQVAKYVCRWRRKNGLEDLKKARHFLEKLMSVSSRFPSRRGWYSLVRGPVARLAETNNLDFNERQIIQSVMGWEGEQDLMRAHAMLCELIGNIEPKPVPLEDSNRHAERA